MNEIAEEMKNIAVDENGMELVETAVQEVADPKFGKGVKVLTVIGVLAAGGYLLYKYVIKPRLNKNDTDGIIQADAVTYNGDYDDECDDDVTTEDPEDE